MLDKWADFEILSKETFIWAMSIYTKSTFTQWYMIACASIKIFFFFFFLSGFFFKTIHESQGCRGRRSAFIQLITATSTHFPDTQVSARRLLQGAHLST